MTRTADLTIDVDTLRTWLSERRPVTLLDVRPAAERAEWLIPGSLHINVYDALKAGEAQALADLSLPDDIPVITICGAGKTSLIAAEQLRARGVPARSLAGGMQAWSLAWNTAEVAIPKTTLRVVQVRRTGKGCLSYLISANGEAAVIDAALAPEVYLHLAQQQGWRITVVLDTHIHADHLSRSRTLADQANATLYLPAQERVAFPFIPLRDGDTIGIGTSQLTAVHTPGHTLESTSYLLDEGMLFTGDTVFLAAVGRPDLEARPEEAEARAHLLYASLQRILTLPADTLILPGHTSTPIAFDDRPLAATLADVRAAIPRLQASETTFVAEVLARLPPTPPNHHTIVELNETGALPPADPTSLEAGANRCAIA